MKFEEFSRLFMWGFEGTSISKETKKLLKQAPPAGVILFKRNIQTLSQVKALNASLRKIDPRLWIAVDQEGGRVARLTSPFPLYPPAVTWGFLFQKGKNRKLVAEAGYLLGKELKALGFDLDFAPVLDVNSNPKNPIIGDRAFSDHPKIAAEAALAFAEGLRKAGILACGKHFPGHGDTHQDSHLTLPTVTRSRAVLNKVELFPFWMAVRKKIPMLMTAHVVYPALDPKNPATLSKKILTDLLREKWKYDGVVISDDFEMKAISEKYTYAEACVLALEAGVDMLLICSGGEQGLDVVSQVHREVQKSAFLKEQARASHERILRLRHLK